MGTSSLVIQLPNTIWVRGDGAATLHPSAAQSWSGLALSPAGMARAREGCATVTPGVLWAALDLQQGHSCPLSPGAKQLPSASGMHIWQQWEGDGAAGWAALALQRKGMG